MAAAVKGGREAGGRNSTARRKNLCIPATMAPSLSADEWELSARQTAAATAATGREGEGLI